MQRIINIKFIGLEFDFGYQKDNIESHENLGRIDAEVFVEVENQGDISVIKHQIKLHDVSIEDLIREEDRTDLINDTNSLGDYIQLLRRLIMVKLAEDLNIEIADTNYISPPTLREKVMEIKEETAGLQMALAELTMFLAGGGENNDIY